jgi:hypothetical protein
MADYHEQLTNAGVLLDANGLQPSTKGWRIKYSGDKRTVIDGPFTEAKDSISALSSKASRNPRTVTASRSGWARTKAGLLGTPTGSVQRVSASRWGPLRVKS